MSLVKRFLTRNVGTVDRIIRAIPFAIFAYVWATKSMAGMPLLVFGVLSLMLLLTAITARCSIYALLGLSTCKA